jgi:transposase
MKWQPKKLTKEQVEERRLEGGQLLRETDLSKAEIARRLGVSKTAVGKWAKQMKERRRGLAGLKSRPKPGTNPKLSHQQWQRVLRLLKKGALKFGYETDRWTLGRIRELIKEQYKVEYNARYLSEKLRSLGWSPQVPARKAAERDDELVELWLKKDWPRIKKKLRETKQ